MAPAADQCRRNRILNFGPRLPMVKAAGPRERPIHANASVDKGRLPTRRCCSACPRTQGAER
ncbi:hypothetical protein RA210_U260030 [Rubrivivax sp. A210]|nr:hypothetical protein RA210_U260030 [Rubrivivax sp. A210]